MNLTRTFVSANRRIVRLMCVLSILLLLNGCAVMAGVPVPLRIVSNIHTGYSLYKNLDEDPENDSWYMGYIKSIFGKGKDNETEPESFYVINEDETNILKSESMEIRL